MPKIEMNKEQSELFNDVKKLVKRANQRILVLERLTGEKGTFATKQLYDYLSVTDGISKTGRIKLSKSYTPFQLNLIKKSTEDFLNSGASKVSEVKKILKNINIKSGKDLSYSQVSSVYISGRNYTWIYEYINKSDFWDFRNTAKVSNMNKETFLQQIEAMMNTEVDEDMKKDLEALYYYVMGE